MCEQLPFDNQAQPGIRLSEPLLTAKDVATLLAVSRSSVYEYARRRHNPLPALRIGGHVRFHSSAVGRWLRDQAADQATGVGRGPVESMAKASATSRASSGRGT
jgi:excisionase family DNA binding protein